MSADLETYALIGNCRTAALVGLDGSIDWLCLPHFASGACFAALLGDVDNGRWQIAPIGPSTVRRQYRPNTMILETTFTTPTGVVTIVDFMPRPGDGDGAPIEVVRIVRGVSGTVTVRSDLTVRFDYGQVKPWVQKIDGGIRGSAGPDAIVLRTEVPMRGENYHSLGEATVSAGKEVNFILTYYASHLPTPEKSDVVALEKEAERFWTGWAGECKVDHPWVEPVRRSLLTLKAMTYELTGGIVAAPTTSLPEDLGGERNWDYRYCWIRDASLTLFALLHNGYVDEAMSWRAWLLRAAAGDPEQLQIMYGLHGQRRLTEFEATWLPGYESSKPVRIGNGAHDQFQLDVYGELMGALHLSRGAQDPRGDELNGWELQCVLMKTVEACWDHPDSGIWEVRGPRRQFTHSKMMAWMAVDRTIQDAEKFGFEGPIDQWKKLRDRIHADVCRHGFNKEKNAFTQYYGSDGLDAALLLIPQIGFLKPDDPRYIGTVEAIEKELLVDDIFVLRYRTEDKVDGLAGDESAFLPCAFWLAEAYHYIGRKEQAVAMFEKLLALRNDVGLLSEEYDFKRKRLMGNFPQAFTHVALLATAALLAGERGVHGHDL